MTKRDSPGDGVSWTLDHLEDLLDRHGAAPQDWPAAERAGALALIEADPAARALVDAEARLGRLMAAYVDPVAVPDGLRSRILAAAPAANRPRQPRWRSLLGGLWPFEAGWQPASALAAAAALGLFLGLSGVGAGDAGISFDSAVDSLVLGPTVMEESLL